MIKIFILLNSCLLIDRPPTCGVHTYWFWLTLMAVSQADLFYLLLKWLTLVQHAKYAGCNNLHQQFELFFNSSRRLLNVLFLQWLIFLWLLYQSDPDSSPDPDPLSDPDPDSDAVGELRISSSSGSCKKMQKIRLNNYYIQLMNRGLCIIYNRRKNPENRRPNRPSYSSCAYAHPWE